MSDAVQGYRCWCGLSAATTGRCRDDHDPYDIYKCFCGLHLFSTEQSTAPRAWARHLAHLADFGLKVQALADVMLAPVSARVAREQLGPAWDVLSAAGLVDGDQVEEEQDSG